MSNPLTVQRVCFQVIDQMGNSIGPPTYGIIAYDDYAVTFTDRYDSIEELNEDIENRPCILSLIDSHRFFGEADPNKIRNNMDDDGNFCSNDWQ